MNHSKIEICDITGVIPHKPHARRNDEAVHGTCISAREFGFKIPGKEQSV